MPIVANGEAWSVVRVDSSDPRLIDRTGKHCLATTDPIDRSIYISNEVVPPTLDKVLLHEAAHALMISHGLIDPLRFALPEQFWVFAEEWSAEFMENYGVEATIATAESLGRPLCIRGYCMAAYDE